VGHCFKARKQLPNSFSRDRRCKIRQRQKQDGRQIENQWFIPAVPECSPELSSFARREWARLSAELSKLNLITHLDRGALATYCAAYGFWAEALQQIQKYGTMVKSPTGYPTDPVALPCHCKQAGGDHDARCIRVRLYARKP
jgi:phage terminase small subunit